MKYVHNIPERFTSVEEYLEYASKKTAEELGYKVGDLFELTNIAVTPCGTFRDKENLLVTLTRDDGSFCPRFEVCDSDDYAYEFFDCLIPVKPTTEDSTEAVEEESHQVDTKVAEVVKQPVSPLHIGLNVSFDKEALVKDFNLWIQDNSQSVIQLFLDETDISKYAKLEVIK